MLPLVGGSVQSAPSVIQREAESPHRFSVSAFRTHAARHEVRDAFFDVKLELVVDLGVQRVAASKAEAEEAPDAVADRLGHRWIRRSGGRGSP